ncbi:hypothetical protein GGI04_001068, partial [Coemansia thaxteri]
MNCDKFFLIYYSSQGVTLSDGEIVHKIRKAPDERLNNEFRVLTLLNKREDLGFKIPEVFNFIENKGFVVMTTGFIEGLKVEDVDRLHHSNAIESVQKLRGEIKSLISVAEARSLGIKVEECQPARYGERLKMKTDYFTGVLDDDTQEKLIEKLQEIDMNCEIAFRHNDLSHNNILFHDDGRVKAIIDWEDSE